MADEGVQRIGVTVHTAGESRDVTSVDITREIPSTGPASLPAGSGITAATGTLALEDPGQAIEVRRGSPWFRDRGWPPALGDTVEVDATLNDGPPSRRFTGIVERSSGATDGPVNVDVVDPIDQLHRRVTFEPAARVQRIAGATVADLWLRHEHYVTAALRACGFHHTARPTSSARLFVPMSGSVLPDRGDLEECEPGQSGVWSTTPWGLGLSGVNARWRPQSEFTDGRFELIVYAARRASAGRTRVQFNGYNYTIQQAANVGQVVLSFPTLGQMRVQYGPDLAALPVDVTVPYDEDTPWVRVRTAPGGVVQIWHGASLIFDGTTEPSIPGYNVVSVSSVVLGGGGVSLGPLYLASHTSLAAHIEQPPTAVLHPSPVLTASMQAAPHVEGRDALSFLREVAASTLSDMWLDRDGRLHWSGVGALVARPPVATLTATADLLDLAWEETLEDLARVVTVSCLSPAVTLSRGALSREVILWEPSGGTELADGDTETIWATPAAGVDWLGAVTPSRRTSGDVEPRSSAVGGVRTSETNTAGTWASEAHLLTTVERVNSQTFKLSATARSLPAGEVIELRSPATSTERTSKVPLPRIAGYGRIEWAEVVHTGARVGPEQAPDYAHETGEWVQGADCQVLADWIARWVTAPGAILRDLPIVYRDDLDLGDVVDVIEDAVYHIHVRAVIVGLSESHSAGSSDMTVTLRVLALDQQPATLSTYDQVWAGATLAQRDSEWAGQTLAQFDANPLRRS